MVGVYNDASKNSRWYLEDAASYEGLAPVISELDEDTDTFTITEEALAFTSIYYTTDGTDPTTASTPYTGPVLLTQTCDVKAIACVTVNGTTLYTPIRTKHLVPELPNAPTITVNCDNSVSLTCSNMPEADIRYTINGADPTSTTGTLYNGTPITTLTAGDVLKARAFKGVLYSTVTVQTYAIEYSEAPTLTYDSENERIVITGTGTLYYTTNHVDPVIGDPGVTSGSSPIYISYTGVDEIEVRAIAKDGALEPSCVVVLECLAKPVPVQACDNELTLVCATELAEIHYETNSTGGVPFEPTLSSPIYYDGAFEGIVDGTRIRAKAFKGSCTSVELDYTYHPEHLASLTYYLDGTTVTVTAPVAGATIYYTTSVGSSPGVTPADPADPTTSVYTGTGTSPLDITITGGNYITVIRAFAVKAGHEESCVLRMVTREGYSISNSSDLSKIGANSDKYIILLDDIDASSYTTVATFTGILDGNGHTLNNLTQPLFTNADGARIENLMLKGVHIESASTPLGAIACTAKGYTRIFNCGILPNTADFPEGTHPLVKTTAAESIAGGLVGRLKDDSRVVNCFSYADVQAVKYAAGLVGYNDAGSTTEVTDDKYTKLKTAVVNCMFYGDIKGGTYQYGVYGGSNMKNNSATGINNYNFFRSGSSFNAANGHPFYKDGPYYVGNPTAYNCSFPADERYLTQVEFHRYLLNSNRELCGWWVGSDVAPSGLPTASVQAIPKDASLIYKWVVVPSVAPYPILKPFGKYASITNVTNTGTPWSNGALANPYEGKRLGTLKVTVNSGTHHNSGSNTQRVLYLPITDIDTLHYDFGYYKVQLPYYNTVFGNPDADTWASKYAGNYNASYVVTGWKVTGVTGGTSGSFVEDWQDGYNFVDRDCTNKDLYSVSHRVFAQGGNYYVPNGVTEIVIEAYWGTPIYVSGKDNSYDRVHVDRTGGNKIISFGSHFAPAGTRTFSIPGATVHTDSIIGALETINAKGTVYDYAVVLVGNVQESVGDQQVVVGAEKKDYGFTLMSVDFDFDDEPDYCLEWQLGYNVTRSIIGPVRFDFLPVVELGIACKMHDSRRLLSLGCYHPWGHFEITESALIHFGQFEFEETGRVDGPIILNGGIIDQYTKGKYAKDDDNHIDYVILGGHVVMPAFAPGAHINKAIKTRHCAVNVLGGDYTAFYLTGNYNASVTPNPDNPHCYIDGGRFQELAAAGVEGINGDVYWFINHALVKEFYGGGINKDNVVSGHIHVTIDHCLVNKYCGGPKFGNMESGKTVTTQATSTIFKSFYGAGNGGTNYVQYDFSDATYKPYASNTTFTWGAIDGGGHLDNYDPGVYRDHDYMAQYDMTFTNVSTGTQNDEVVIRTSLNAAQFGTTNTGNVSSTLTDCTVKNNFYGGGMLGGVNGNVTSTLNNTRIEGSVYGAGYSASVPEVIIQEKDKLPPTINFYTGEIYPQTGGTSHTYTWSHNNGGSTASPVVGSTFYTENEVTGLGSVSGNTKLTLEGGTTVLGSVFGGGEESAVGGNTLVHVKDHTKVYGNVYGGGDQGMVGGNTKVVINGKDLSK